MTSDSSATSDRLSVPTERPVHLLPLRGRRPCVICSTPGSRRSRSSSSRPKTDEGERQLWQAIRELEPLRADLRLRHLRRGRVEPDRTIRVTEGIATETTLTPVGHLTAVGHSVAELRRVIGDYAGAGIRNVLALRGDPPGGPAAPWERHPEGLTYATELVRLVRALGDFCVGVAAFPDKHPESLDLEADARRLVEKCDAGADFAITQFFFSADAYFRLRDRVAALGCDDPDPARDHAGDPTSRRSSGWPSCPARSSRRAGRAAARGRRRPGRGARDRRRGGLRAGRAAARRRGAGPALLHAEPVHRDPGGHGEPAALSPPAHLRHRHNVPLPGSRFLCCCAKARE